MAVPQKLKIELSYEPAIPLLGIYPKELKTGSQRVICTPTLIAALFTIVKTWKQPKGPLMDEWLSKVFSIRAMEYYSAFKRKGILQHATTWMNLKDIVLSEMCPSQKDKFCVIPLIGGT